MAQDFEKILKILKEMQDKNETNSKSFDKLLESVNNRLEKGSDISTDLIKAYVNELSKSVENKYDITLEKFGAIENAIKAVYQGQTGQIKQEDLKDLFGVFTKSINNLYTEIKQEKAVLSSVENKISDIINNKTDKQDILRTISLLRKDFENLNFSYKSIINDVNTNLKNIISYMVRLDPLKSNEDIKLQIEVTYKAVNEILNQLDNIEDRNKNLEKILSNTATNEELSVTRAIVDQIEEKTQSIQNKINDFAEKKDIENISDLIKDKAEILINKEDFSKIEKANDELLSNADTVKRALAKITQDIENIPNTNYFESSLKSLYIQLDKISQELENADFQSAYAETHTKLDKFSDEFENIKNIVSDLYDVTHNRILESIEEFDFDSKTEEIKKDIKEALKNIPNKEDIEKILSYNDQLLIDIFENTKDISKKIYDLEEESKFEDIKKEAQIISQEILKIANSIEKLTTVEDIEFLRKDHTEMASQIRETANKLENSSLVNNIADIKEDNEQIIQEIRELANRLESIKNQCDIENILQTNNDIASDIRKMSEKLEIFASAEDIKKITETTDNIAKQISQANFNREFSKIYDKTDNIEKWLINSRIKESVDETSTYIKTKADQKDVLEIYKYTEQIVKNLQELTQSTNLDDINNKIANIGSKIEDIRELFNNNFDYNNGRIVYQISKIERDIATNSITAKDFSNAISELKRLINEIISNIQNKEINEADAILFQKEIKEQINKLDFTNVVDILNKQYANINESINRSETDLSLISEHIHKHLPVNLDKIKNDIESIKQILKDTTQENVPGIEVLKQSFEELKNVINSKIENQFNNLIQEKVNQIEASIADCNNYNETRFANITSMLENFSSAFETDNNNELARNITSELENLKEQINSIGNSFQKLSNSEYDEIKTFLKDKINNIGEDISSISEGFENRIIQNFNYNTELIEGKATALQEMLVELSSNIKNADLSNQLNESEKQLEDFKQEIDLIKTDLSEHFDNKFEEIINKIEPIKDNLKSNTTDKFFEKIQNDINELQNIIIKEDSFYNETSKLNDLYSILSQNIVDAQNNVKDFVVNDTDSVIIKLDNLKSYIEEIFENNEPFARNVNIDLSEFKKDLKDFKEEQKEILNNGISEIKNEIKAQNDEIKSILSVAANHDDIIDAIDTLKHAIKNRLSTFTQVKDDSNSISLSDIISEDITSSISNIREDFKAFQTRINNLTDKNTNIEAILENLNNKIDNISSDISEPDSHTGNSDNVVSLNEVFNTLESFKEDFNILQDTVKNILENTEKNNSASNEEDILKIYEDNKEFISSLAPAIVSEIEGSFNNIVEDMYKKIDNISKQELNTDELLSKINTLDAKIDTIAECNNDEILEDIYDSLDENIAKKIREINSKLDVLASEDNSELFEELTESDMQITSMLEDLRIRIDLISKNGNLDEIKQLITDQRNYIEDFAPNNRIETFKKCLDELSEEVSKISSDQIGQNDFKTSLKEMKESIMSAVVSIFDQVSFIEESEDIKDFVEERTDEINKNIATITKQLQQMSNIGDYDDYTYSMQDIETDLAKLRLALKNIQDERIVTQEEEFSQITEKLHQITSSVDNLTQDEIKALKSEISNLKEQTQFLIATSDRSYNTLNSGDFGEILNGNLTGKVDKVTAMLEKSANTDSVIRQSLIYMGEWIDSASESINKISANSEEIEKITEILDNLKNTQQEQLSKIETEFNKFEYLEDKLEEQTRRIDKIEMSIDKVLNAIENIDDTSVTRKIDKIEKQLSKLGTNIEKLASYVD